MHLQGDPQSAQLRNATSACETQSPETQLTTQYVVAIRSQTHKVFLVDVAGEGVDGVRAAEVPQLELAVRRPAQEPARHASSLPPA